MRIAFAYNVNHHAPSDKAEAQAELDFDSPKVINEIKETIESLGHFVFMVEADNTAFEKLRKHKSEIDLVFNIAEGLYGDARESQIPLFCEMLGIPYTHSSPTTHAIKLNKSYCKLLLKGVGVLVPTSLVVKTTKDISGTRLNYPLIVKPNTEGSSKGIFDKNVVKNYDELLERVQFVSDQFKTEVLVEEYIDGREFTVALLGNKDPQVLPIIEQKFDFLPPQYNKIASFELKWIFEEEMADISEGYGCPAKISKKLEKKIIDTSRKIYTTLNIRESARIDFRLDKNENLYFLEINTLPGINNDAKAPSYYVYAARKAGMTYQELIGKLIFLACERYNIGVTP